jgi:hypothetical protein
MPEGLSKPEGSLPPAPEEGKETSRFAPPAEQVDDTPWTPPELLKDGEREPVEIGPLEPEDLKVAPMFKPAETLHLGGPGSKQNADMIAAAAKQPEGPRYQL